MIHLRRKGQTSRVFTQPSTSIDELRDCHVTCSILCSSWLKCGPGDHVQNTKGAVIFGCALCLSNNDVKPLGQSQSNQTAHKTLSFTNCPLFRCCSRSFALCESAWFLMGIVISSSYIQLALSTFQPSESVCHVLKLHVKVPPGGSRNWLMRACLTLLKIEWDTVALHLAGQQGISFQRSRGCLQHKNSSSSFHAFLGSHFHQEQSLEVQAISHFCDIFAAM